MSDDDRNYSAIVASVCFLGAAVIVIVALLGLCGCTPAVEHRVTAPQLDTAIKALQKPACPPLMPIPAKMLVDIDGQHIETDADGERFMRAYISVRDCQRGAQ